MKQAIIFLVSLTLCSLAYATTPGPTQTDLDQVLSDESFQATVEMLQSRGIIVNLSAKDATRLDSDEILFGDLEPVAMAMSFPVIGDGYEQILFVKTEDGMSRVAVVRSTADERDSAMIQKASCGAFLYWNNCDYGPWYSGSSCPGGPLYKYTNFSRANHQYGRKVYANYDWFSCSWMAQDSSCQTNCS